MRFQLMRFVNASTGFSPFQLHIGRAPRMIPPLVDGPECEFHAHAFLTRLDVNILEAQNNLSHAKAMQAYAANE
jgi:hypothetical protein